MKPFFLFLLFVSCACVAFSQSIFMPQVGTLGGEMESASGPLITHSMGAVVATSIEEGLLRIDQGMFLACDFLCTGVKTDIDAQLYANPWLTLFPNPTTGLLRLEGETRHIHRYELYAPSGQQLAAKQIKENQLSLSNYPSGLYFLRIYGQQGELSYVGKVVKE